MEEHMKMLDKLFTKKINSGNPLITKTDYSELKRQENRGQRINAFMNFMKKVFRPSKTITSHRKGIDFLSAILEQRLFSINTWRHDAKPFFDRLGDKLGIDNLGCGGRSLNDKERERELILKLNIRRVGDSGAYVR